MDEAPGGQDDFARFVAKPGFRTEAESFGFSAVCPLAVARLKEQMLGGQSGKRWWLSVKTRIVAASRRRRRGRVHRALRRRRVRAHRSRLR